MNANRLAGALGVNCQNVYELVGDKRGVSAAMALRLARWSGTSPGFWLRLQSNYDLELATEESGEKIAAEVRPLVRDTG